MTRTKRNKAAKSLMVVAGTGIPGNNTKPTRLTKLGIERTEALAMAGLREQSIAAILGVSVDSWNVAREAQPELAAAFQRGRAMLEAELAGLVIQKAREGSIPAIIFGLKNVANWSDGGIRGEAAPQLQVNIQIPPSMSPDEFQAIVDGKTIDAKPKASR